MTTDREEGLGLQGPRPLGLGGPAHREAESCSRTAGMTGVGARVSLGHGLWIWRCLRCPVRSLGVGPHLWSPSPEAGFLWMWLAGPGEHPGGLCPSLCSDCASWSPPRGPGACGPRGGPARCLPVSSAGPVPRDPTRSACSGPDQHRQAEPGAGSGHQGEGAVPRSLVPAKSAWLR